MDIPGAAPCGAEEEECQEVEEAEGRSQVVVEEAGGEGKRGWVEEAC